MVTDLSNRDCLTSTYKLQYTRKYATYYVYSVYVVTAKLR